MSFKVGKNRIGFNGGSGGGGGGTVQSVVAGTNISVDSTDPANPIVSSTVKVPIEVANYAALPDPTTVPGQPYIVLASQGTRWLPGSLGGTYYPRGYYYSDGTAVWVYSDVPYNASQPTVDTGTNNDEFITPLTFTNASKWNTKENTIAAGLVTQYWRGDKTWQVLDTLVVPENTNLYFTNARAIASTLTGYVSGAGVISSADTILQAIQKLNGNAGAAVTIVDDTTTNATMYPTWVTANSGALPLKVSSTKISFNPSTGTLTTLLVDVATSVTTPVIIGGSGVTSKIRYDGSTNATPTSTAIAHDFMVGNSASVNAMGIYHDGQVLVGTSTRNPATVGIFRVAQGTAFVDIGESAAGLGAIWLSATAGTPSATNYALRNNVGTLNVNSQSATGDVVLSYLGTTRYTFGSRDITLSPGTFSSGIASGFTFNGAASTLQTAGTESITVNWNLSSTLQHASNTAIATQRDFLIRARTHSFASLTGTITDAGTLVIDNSPQVGPNAAITNAYALWVQAGKSKFGGNVELTQTVTTEVVVSDTTVTIRINGTNYKLLAKA